MAGAPRIGVSAFGLAASEFVQLSQAVEDAGLQSVWVAEHALLPVGYRSVHPQVGHGDASGPAEPVINAETLLMDPLVTLAAVAQATQRVELVTGIMLLPLQHPLLVARAARTLQELSGGRLRLGVSAGWLSEEFDALQVPFGRRGRRLEEGLQILAAATRGGTFSFQGEEFQFGDVQLGQDRVSLPVIVGGHAPAALRRAARHADGWFTSGNPDLGEVLKVRERLHGLCAEYGRPPLEIHARIQGADPEVVRRYLAEGIDSIVVWADAVWPRSVPLDARQDHLNRFAGSVLP
ncbi:hypothetical protein GQ85_08240 [Rhodococcus rhodochrous]|nr:hypothetical protein GQ85_08240 [Rhodococcus rhodochrous]